MGIVACEKCGCANVSDSRFCRACGFEIGASIIREPSSAELKMIDDARRLFADGRYDQAALVVTAVLDENPYCVEALAIMGDCHEQLGYFSLALRCYKDVMKISPESKLDMMRVSRLERLVASGEILVPALKPKRNSLVGAAIAATLLFVSSGSALIIASDIEGKASTGDIESVVQSQPFMPIPPIASNRTDYAPNLQTPPTDSDIQSLPVAEKKGVVAPLFAKSEPREEYRSSGVLPGISGEIESEVPPVKIDPRTVPTQTPVKQGVDPDPPVVGAPGPTTKPIRNSIVDVRSSKNIDPVAGTQPVEDNSAKIDTLIRVARDQFVLGNFAKSADAYEKAIHAGAPLSTTNQRLAQCYEKLGRMSDAIGAYSKAIIAFEQMDQSDVRVQTQLDSCRQAVKILRGT